MQMLALYQQTITAQYEAALAMLKQCIEACPPKHWESLIAQGTFRWVAYHTLFWCDLYLSPSNESFQLREFHGRGGDERGPEAAPGLSQEEALAYVAMCRQKVHESLAAETEETLAGGSGFHWYKNNRSEMHLVNIRHIQHHTGQLSAFLRRVDDRLKDRGSLGWVRSGWR
jgi:hypothetical protein